MDALTYLKIEHRLITEAMVLIAKSSPQEKGALTSRLKHQVEMHDLLEVEVTLTAISVGIDLEILPGPKNSRNSRTTVRKSLAMLTFHPSDLPDWLSSFQVTQSLFLRQMAGEEQGPFKAIRDAMGWVELRSLGACLKSERARLALLNSGDLDGLVSNLNAGLRQNRYLKEPLFKRFKLGKNAR